MIDEPLALLAEAFGQDPQIRLATIPSASNEPAVEADRAPVALDTERAGASVTVLQAFQTA